MPFIAPVLAFARRIPPIVWYLIVIAAVYLISDALLSRAIDNAYDRGFDERTKQFDAELVEERAAAAAWKLKYQATSAAITAQTGEEHAQNVADVGARADALLVRGPGAAASCPRSHAGAVVPAPASGFQAAGGAGASAVPGVSADEGLVSLPWGILVERARDADTSREEVLTWRSWYAQQDAAHSEALAQ